MGTIYIGRYKVIEELGRGGMGVVYRGEDPVLERQVAIKVLPPKKMNPKSIERFLREAKTAARLDSPYIVKIHDIGQIDDIHFIVMEYVEGSSLSDLIEYEEIPPYETLRKRLSIFRQVLEAVSYAHQNGVIHRDLKPDNIMVNKSGQVKVMDFGLAFFMGHHSLTEIGQVMGTAAYVSPEQAAGKLTDPRTDIYSLGVILFELITGRWPFSASNPLEMFRKVMEEPPPSPKVFNQETPLALEALVLRALRKKPEDRFASVAEMLESLDLCLKKDFASEAPPASLPVGGASASAPAVPLPSPAATPASFSLPSGGGVSVPQVDKLVGSKTPQRLPDPASLRQSALHQNESLLASDPHALKVTGTAEEAALRAGAALASSIAGNKRLPTPSSKKGSKDNFDSATLAAVPSAPQPNLEAALREAPARPKSYGLPASSSVRKKRPTAGVVTIGGEAAFRTSMASYAAQQESSLMEPSVEGTYTPQSCGFNRPQPENPPVPPKVVPPPPGPALRKPIQETSVAAPPAAQEPFSAPGPAPIPTATAVSTPAPPAPVKPAPVKVPEPEKKESAEPSAEVEAVNNRFVGGSGSPLASNAWMADVEEKPEAEAAEAENEDGDYVDFERDPKYLLKQAQLHLEKGRYQEAKEAFQELVEVEPQNMEGLVGLGRSLTELGDLGPARENIERAIKLYPDSAIPYVALADFYTFTEQPALIISALHKALDRNEYDLPSRCRLAYLYFDQGRAEVALEQYCLALQQGESDFQTNLQLGLLLWALQRASEAAPCLERACIANPKSSISSRLLAGTCLSLGRASEGQSVLEHGLETGVKVSGAWYEQSAAIYQALKNEKAAVTELTRALELEPGHEAASIRLATILCLHQQYADAVQILNRSLEYHPHSINLNRRLGEVYILGGNLEKAMDHFERIVQLDPACAENYNRLGKLHFKKQYDASSVARYQKEVEAHPVSSAVREDLAMAYYCSGRYQEALAELVKACRLDYTNPEYPKTLGIMLLELGASEDAMRQLQASLTLNPNDGQARGMLGKALAAQGLNNLAIVEYQKAIESDPQNLYLFNLPLARAYAMQGRQEQAVNCFKRFLSTVPDNGQLAPIYAAYIEVGKALVAEGSYKAALEIFTSILRRDPYEEGAYQGLAQMALNSGNYQSASRYVEEGLSSVPRSPELLLLKADLLAAQDRWSQAVNVLVEANREAPQSHKIVEQLGRAYRKCGRFQDAIDVFSKAVEEFPDWAAHFEWLKGRVLYRQGQYEAASWSYQQALTLDPNDWRLYLDLGKAYSSLQRLDDAASSYRSAERLAPEGEKKQIRSLLQRLRR